MKFKDYLKSVKEQTTAGDIAPVDSRLGGKPAKVKKYKKCKQCTTENCSDCKYHKPV
jgi:hypothetical protein